MAVQNPVDMCIAISYLTHEEAVHGSLVGDILQAAFVLLSVLYKAKCHRPSCRIASSVTKLILGCGLADTHSKNLAMSQVILQQNPQNL